MRCLPRLLIVASISLTAAPVWSAITYVDATPNTNGSDGNTTANGALVTLYDSTLGGSGNVTTDFNNTDHLWRYRSNAALNGGAAWETHNDTETTEPLITTLTLSPGFYNLYGLFWGGAGSSFIAEFRVGASGPFTYFDTGNGTLTASDGSDFANSVAVRWPAGFADLYLASLGEFPITSSIDVYINGPVTQLTADPRTVYEGLGYEFTRPIPEPYSIILMITGVTCAIGISRRVPKKVRSFEPRSRTS